MSGPVERADDAVLAGLGERLARCRLDRELTQAELAEQAGVSKRTVERLEAGASVQLASFIRVLRALDLLGALEHAIPATGPRPMELLKGKGKPRQRAPGSRVADDPGEEAWTWDEDA